jgi:UDPglucose 6-dehydrogenase
MLHALIDAGAKVMAYDPVAMPSAKRELPARWFDAGSLKLVDKQYDALNGADAMVLMTEWKPFRHPDFPLMKKLLKQPVIFDGRNQYDLGQIRAAGFEYQGIGRRV